jgi:hypothetical protein
VLRNLKSLLERVQVREGLRRRTSGRSVLAHFLIYLLCSGDELIIQFYFVISTYLGGDTNSVTDEIQEILNTLGQVLTESVSVERAMNHAILIVQVNNDRGSEKVSVNI